MGSEMFIGAAIGLLGRVFFIALEFIGVAIAMSVGLSSNLGAPVEADEPLPALTTLMTLAATALMFLTDLHLEVFRALQASYANLPVADGFRPRFALDQLVTKSSEAFLLALRIGSPFLIFSLVVNVAMGLLARVGAGDPDLLPRHALPSDRRADPALAGVQVHAAALHRGFRPLPGVGMTERLKALKRVLKVQDQLKKTADWRLAEAERAATAVETARDDLAGFLSRADLVGPLAGLAVAQARRLAVEGRRRPGRRGGGRGHAGRDGATEARRQGRGGAGPRGGRRPGAQGPRAADRGPSGPGRRAGLARRRLTTARGRRQSTQAFNAAA